jgi:hypothetical protein
MNKTILDILISEGKITRADVDEIETRLKRSFPMKPFYEISNGKRAGIFTENYLEEKVKGIFPKSIKTEEYDRETKDGDRIEIKMIRLLDQENKDLPFTERALPLSAWDEKKGNFQQTKVKSCDFILGLVIGKDDAQVFLVPSSHIVEEPSKQEEGKITLSIQHRGHKTEGHLTAKSCLPYEICRLSELKDLENYLKQYK